MASDSKSLETNAAAKWEVGPKEDVVQAFIELLVNPRLPLRGSAIDPPSLDAQKSIARQMHAVVLLYNYYHRRQKPELEFLDFVSFCKLAVSLRPPLLPFMKLMNQSKSVELNGSEDQLSVTEKAIKNACDIALALDASINVPNAEEWPISKIAVVLIDKNNETCRLQFGAITEGVWSSYEKEVNESCTVSEVSAENKVVTGNKRKRNADGEFLQLVYDVVKDIPGIDSSNLTVVGTHVTYSLSKEKSATRVYLIRCPQTFIPRDQVPIKFLVESLQGPLAEKDFGSWSCTRVVEFHHMLPYVEFLLCGLSGKGSRLPIFGGSTAQNTSNSCVKELTQSKTTVSPVLNRNGEDSDHINNNRSKPKPKSCVKVANRNSDNNRKKCKQSSGGEAEKDASIISLVDLDKESNESINGSLPCSDIVLPQRLVKDDAVMEKSNKRTEKVETLSTKSKHLQENCLSASSPKTVIGGRVYETLKKTCDTKGSSVREERRSFFESSVKEGDESQKVDSLSDPSRGLKMIELSKTLANGDNTSEKPNSKIKVYHHKKKTVSSTQHDVHGLNETANTNVELVDPLKSNECRDEKVSGDDGDFTVSCDQNAVALTDKRLLPFEAVAKNNVRVQSVPASAEIRNALALLHGKREELLAQICSMEDELAVYEDNIERIRDGGDVGLAGQCIRNIINGNSLLMPKHENQIQSEFHQSDEDHSKSLCLYGTIFPGKSSCQDLEYICHKNNWRLPRYFVEPSNGKYLSNLVVQSNDFKLSTTSDLESSPSEARESAAAQMIAEIRNFA